MISHPDIEIIEFWGLHQSPFHHLAERGESVAHKGIFKNIEISDADAIAYRVEQVEATLTVGNFIIGDTNGDGMILIGDVISILNYILGSPSDNFNVKAADVNGDGMILIGDVIAVLNIILNQS